MPAAGLQGQPEVVQVISQVTLTVNTLNLPSSVINNTTMSLLSDGFAFNNRGQINMHHPQNIAALLNDSSGPSPPSVSAVQQVTPSMPRGLSSSRVLNYLPQDVS